MISAKLIKDLENKGFSLDFPSYDSKDIEIMEILLANNERLNLAIPLLLMEGFDYEKIIKGLEKPILNKLNKIILITDRIFISENIDNTHLKNTIKKHKITGKISENEIAYYHESFKNSLAKRKETAEQDLKEQIDIRNQLNTNKALNTLYSPGKKRIMNKIFNHEPLTNTELKYYYKSIRPINQAILNENLQKYARIIETTKKYAIKQ